MFAKIHRGDRMAGLMVYLAGPGRANEHTRPHVVAGSPGVEAWHAGGELDRDSALGLARYLEWPSRVHDTEVRQGVRELVATGARGAGGQRVMERRLVVDEAGRAVMADAHVYHVPLSLRAVEGEMGDELWGVLAHEFMARMGFTDTRPLAAGGTGDEVSGEDVPVRWAAVHHGASKDGNDHVHLVVNLVDEDGATLDVNNDFHRARQVCRDLEDEYELMPLHPNEYELARTYARTAHERERRAELVADAGAQPRMVPWAELSEEQQHPLMAAECGTDRDWQRALRGRDRHADPGTAAPLLSHGGAQEAQGRAQARAVHQRRLEEGTAVTPWDSLPAAERARLVAAATPAEDPRATLARAVRGCATASADEAEFVRRLRGYGRDPRSGRPGVLLVRPRFAAGRTDVVEGYSVALRPPSRAERAIWQGGNRLGKDLSITRLREEWTRRAAVGPRSAPQDLATQVAAAQGAVAEWTAAKAGRPVVTSGREESQPTDGDAAAAAAELRALRTRLAGVDVGDRDTWARAHRETAGVLAAWSGRVEGLEVGPLGEAAHVLARGAETASTPPPSRRRMPSITGSAFLVAAAAGTGPAAELAMIKALMDLVSTLAAAQSAAREALQVQRVEAVLAAQLATIQTRLVAETREPVTIGGAAATTPDGRRTGQGTRDAQAQPDGDSPGEVAAVAGDVDSETASERARRLSGIAFPKPAQPAVESHPRLRPRPSPPGPDRGRDIGGPER